VDVTPERLREIERLFHEARERPPAERDAWSSPLTSTQAASFQELTRAIGGGTAPRIAAARLVAAVATNVTGAPT
jgi:hypothetical protein